MEFSPIVGWSKGTLYDHGEHYIMHNVKYNDGALQTPYIYVSCVKLYMGNNEKYIGDLCIYLRYVL